MTDPAPTKGPDPVPLFSEYLAVFDDGAVDRELAQALHELTEACALIRKKGSLTLTFTLNPEDDVLTFVTPAVTVKLPVETRTKVPQFRQRDGSLGDNHPSKQRLPFPNNTTTKE